MAASNPSPDRQYHIQLEPGQAGRYAFLPGDPGRCELIASALDDPYFVASNREFTTWNGFVQGQLVSVCSTGVGSASTSIAMEELAKLGTDTFIRVGTCGSMVEKVKGGDLVIMHSAIRRDGSSIFYAPIEFPATADYWVTNALATAAAASGLPWHLGLTVSNAAFYAGVHPEETALLEALNAYNAAWRKCGVLAVEEEAALMYVLAAVKNWRAGAICAPVNDFGAKAMPKVGSFDLRPLIKVAVAGLARLIDLDAATADKAHDRTLLTRLQGKYS